MRRKLPTQHPRWRGPRSSRFAKRERRAGCKTRENAGCVSAPKDTEGREGERPGSLHSTEGAQRAHETYTRRLSGRKLRSDHFVLEARRKVARRADL
jgi:hypothetical protein